MAKVLERKVTVREDELANCYICGIDYPDTVLIETTTERGQGSAIICRLCVKAINDEVLG